MRHYWFTASSRLAICVLACSVVFSGTDLAVAGGGSWGGSLFGGSLGSGIGGDGNLATDVDP